METKVKGKSRREFFKIGAIAAGAVVVATEAPLAVGETKSKRPRWGLLIDLDRCIGCKACAVACKTEDEVPLGVFRASVKELDEGTYPNVKRSFVPWLCNHCNKPACLENCPVDEVEAEFVWPDGTVEKYMKRATYKRPDGVVLIDQDRCVGCGSCVEDCPYGVRFLNPAKKTVSADAVDDHPAEKCDLCVHRFDDGLVPACVNTCQAGARVIGDLNDPNSEISKIIKSKPVEVLLPEAGTDPQCFYVSLNPDAYSGGRDTR
jgi:tetrathionate reductase subunit B